MSKSTEKVEEIPHVFMNESSILIKAKHINKLLKNECTIQKLKKSFTKVMEDKFGTRTTKLYAGFRYNKEEYYCFPRFAAAQSNKYNLKKYLILSKKTIKVHKNLYKFPEKLENIAYEGILRKHQDIVVTHLLKYHYFNGKYLDIQNNNDIDLSNNKNSDVAAKLFVRMSRQGLVLKMETGRGKTHTAFGIMDNLKVRTLIVVPTKPLKEQWYDQIKKFIPDANVVQYNPAKSMDVFEGDILIGVINGLLKKDRKFFSNFGLSIFDEVHKYSSRTNKKIFRLASSFYMLGMTATPERIDQQEIVNYLGCGPLVDSMDIPTYSDNISNIEFNSYIRVINYYGPDELTKAIVNPKTEALSYTGMVNQLIEDDFRNQIIVDKTVELVLSGTPTFIFSAQRDHLDTLSDMINEKVNSMIDNIDNSDDISIDDIMEDSTNIPNYINDKISPYVIPDISKEILRGGVNMKKMEEDIKKSNLILATYQFLDTGISIPHMEGIFLSIPRKNSLSQPLGRILRIDGNIENDRIVYDLVDSRTALKNQYYTRKKTYKEKGFKIDSFERIEYVE